eukprot:351369-Chlamydomonas_euryale.AAC.3
MHLLPGGVPNEEVSNGACRRLLQSGTELTTSRQCSIDRHQCVLACNERDPGEPVHTVQRPHSVWPLPPSRGFAYLACRSGRPDQS